MRADRLGLKLGVKTDAGVDPALINVIDAFLPFVSAFVIISTAVMVDRWRFGVRICAAGYGGLMGETLFLMLGRSALKTDSPWCCLWPLGLATVLFANASEMWQFFGLCFSPPT